MALPTGVTHDRRELRALDETIRWILERMPDAVLIVDGDGVMRFASAAASALFGYAPGELEGNAVEMLVPKERRARHEALRDAFRREPARRPLASGREFEGVRRDGSRVVLLISLRPIRTTDGTFVVATLVDATAHAAAEREVLRRHEARARARMVEDAPLCLAMFDRSLTYLAASRAWRETYTRSGADVVGRKRDEVHRVVPEPWKDAARRALAGETVHQEEDMWTRWDGSRRWVKWVAHPWTDEEGAIAGIIVAAEDITQRKDAEQAFRASSARFAQVFHANPVGTVLSRFRDGRIVDVNPAMLAIFGFERDEVIGHDAVELGAWPALDDREALFELLRKTGTARGVDARFRRKSGEIGHGIASAEIIDLHGEPHILGMLTDVTERRRTEAALRASEVRFRSVVDQAADGFFVHTSDGQILDVNRYACTSLGYEREELLERNVWDVHFLRSGHGYSVAQHVQLGAPITLDADARRADGTIFPVEIRLGCIEAEGERALVSLVRDVSQRHALERSLERAEERARTDPLTGLANRSHFLEVAGHEWTRARRYRHSAAVFMIDLDRFKSINDVHGHPAGDVVLQAFASVGRAALREVDLLGRFGGEEFAAILPETELAQALHAAERLRIAAERAAKRLVCGSTVPFTVSIGVALFDPSDADVDAALKRADRALYEAKRTGRNRVCVA